MGRNPKIVLLPLGAVGVVTLGACGSDSLAGSGSEAARGSSGAQSPAAVIRASLAAAKSAKTFRLTGSGTDSGQTFDIDLRYGNNGSDGTISSEGSKIQVKLVDSYVYFKAPDAFWQKSGAAALRAYGGKWVKTPTASETGKGFNELADSKALVDSFTGSLTADDEKSIKRLGTATVNGVAVTNYGDASGTIAVPTSGTPYPAKLVSRGSEGGILYFSDWNQPYTVTPPPASQTVKQVS